MFEIIACVSGATLAVIYLRSMMKRYYILPSLRKNSILTGMAIRNRTVVHHGTNHIDSFEYPSSTYVTARLPHVYLRDYL